MTAAAAPHRAHIRREYRYSSGWVQRLLALSQLSTVTPQHYYYHADGNGNITFLINSSQTIAAKYLYDPYGNILSQSGSMADANLYRFSSKELHANSGLVYYLYRFYDPNLQRWLNRDPLADKGIFLVAAANAPGWAARLGRASGVAPLELARANRNLYRFSDNSPVGFFDTYGLDPAFCPGIGIFCSLSPNQEVAACKQSAPVICDAAAYAIQGACYVFCGTISRPGSAASCYAMCDAIADQLHKLCDKLH
jgi:RHS repeat-associated protein